MGREMFIDIADFEGTDIKYVDRMEKATLTEEIIKYGSLENKIKLGIDNAL